MLQEPFAVGNSFIHQLDPRMRLLITGAFAVVVALSYDFRALSAALVVSLVLVMCAQLPARRVINRLLMVNGLIALLWVALPLTFQGPSSRVLGPLTLYHAGIFLAAQITLKSNAIVLILIALVTTMNFSDLGYALNWLKVPPKLVHLLLMTYRYVFLIEQEYQRLVRAIKVRGFRLGTDLHTYKTYACIVGMLLVRSAERAERVYHAMLCRGFRRQFYCLHEFSMRRSEWLFAVVMGGVIVLLACLEWHPGGLVT